MKLPTLNTKQHMRWYPPPNNQTTDEERALDLNTNRQRQQKDTGETNRMSNQHREGQNTWNGARQESEAGMSK